MDATKTANINTFEPPSDFVQEGDCDTLLLYLPGFVKEQLRVQLARSGVLKISGTRPLGDNNKWSSFQKEFPVSANCDTSRITAKFEEGILYVRQPKAIVPAAEHTPAGPAKTANNNINNNNNREKEAAVPKIMTPPADHKEANKDEKESSEPRSEVTDKVDKGKADGGAREMMHDAKARQPSDELKVARQKMTVVLVALLAFVVGMWIKNLQGWFSGGIPADE